MRELHWKARRTAFIIVRRGKPFVLPSHAAKTSQRVIIRQQPPQSQSQSPQPQIQHPQQQSQTAFPGITINTNVAMTPRSTTAATSPLPMIDPSQQPPRRRSNNRIPDLR